MDFLSIFPDHVLELIFSNLKKEKILPSTSRNRGDLIEATLISPKANKIISKSANLMKNTRFELEGSRELPNTRKYKQIDLLRLQLRSTFDHLPTNLTQLTFDECKVEARALHDFLSRNSETLELLIFSRCLLFDDENCSEPLQPRVEKRNLQLPKLRTLILTEMTDMTEMILILIIRATNLTELGLVRHENEPDFEPPVPTMFVDLIKANPNLETLHVPARASELFLTYARENVVKFKLEDLSLDFIFYNQDNVNNCDIFLDFLETQKDSLKILKLAHCYIEEEHFVRLLSLNLTRLEIHRSKIQLSRIVENSTIEVLALFRIYDMRDAVVNLIKCCKNLVAFDAAIWSEIGFTLLWWTFDIEIRQPKRVSWADLRGLRYAGLICGTEIMREFPELLLYRKRFKKLPVDKHPNSLIQLEETRWSFFRPRYWSKFLESKASRSVVNTILAVEIVIIIMMYKHFK